MAQLTTLHSDGEQNVHNDIYRLAIMGIKANIILPAMSFAANVGGYLAQLLQGTNDTFAGVVLYPATGGSADGLARTLVDKERLIKVASVAGSPAVGAAVYCATNNPNDMTTVSASAILVGRITDITTAGTWVRILAPEYRDPSQAA